MAGLDLPATYEEWLQQQARGSGKNGDAVIEVDVNPSEFVRYLQATKATTNLKELQAFASAKAGVATTNRDPVSTSWSQGVPARKSGWLR
jgi:hypothetical protein